MAAVLADGTTVIDNAAREPEIVDLAAMLSQMGAQIEGVGTSTLTVARRRPRCSPTEHRTVIGDRIVGGTWAFAAAMTRGEVTVRGVDPHHLDLAAGQAPHAAGAQIATGTTAFTVRMDGRPSAVDFVTLPYPGFATDLQPMAIALAAVADGTSMITENVFEARFRFVDEMVRLGADARTDGHHAVVAGSEQLSSAPVWATDIRAGAGLVLAGLCADGVTEVWRRRCTSTAATRGSSRTCRASGPTSPRGCSPTPSDGAIGPAGWRSPACGDDPGMSPLRP